MRNMDRRLGFLIAAGVAASIWVACSETGDAPTVRTRGTPGVAPSIAGGLLRAEAARRIDDVTRQKAWVGHIHNQIMRDVWRNRPMWATSGRNDPTRLCASLVQLVAGYRPVIDGQAGRRMPDDVFRLAVRTALSHSKPECAAESDMYLFGSLTAMSGQSGDSDVTGAFETYLIDMQDRVRQTDGTPAQVNPVTYSTLANASSLVGPDFELLASATSVTDSSSSFWTNYFNAGGREVPMSLVAHRQGGVLVVVLADLIGCALVVEGLQDAGVDNAILLGAGCLVGAAISSGLAVLALEG